MDDVLKTWFDFRVKNFTKSKLIDNQVEKNKMATDPTFYKIFLSFVLHR